MAIAESTAAANLILDSGLATCYPAGSILEIRSGAPAGVGAVATGTLLASITLPASPWAAAAARSKGKSGTWSVAAVGTGTAGHYRLKTAGDGGLAVQTDPRQEGTVTATGGGGDMTLDNISIATGQTVTINTFAVSV